MRGRALIPAILITVLTAGCAGSGGDEPTAIGPSQDNGVSSLPAEQILAKTAEAAITAKSVRISGGISTGEDNFKIDMRTDGTDARGTIETEENRFEILKVGGQVYVRANQAYWQEALPELTAAQDQALAGKWVKAASGTYNLFGDLSSVDKLVRPPAKNWTKGAVREHYPPHDLTVIGLDSDTDYSLMVSVKGPPYPAQVGFPGASGALDLTEWGRSVQIEPPAPGDVVDLPAG